METIYPANIKKYFGGITKRGNNYTILIKTGNVQVCATKSSREEAEKFIKDKNIELGLDIRNVIYDMGDHYEVSLTDGQNTYIDKEDIEIIEAHLWCASKCRNSWYVLTRINGKTFQLHNAIMNHIPDELTVDHIDQNPLNNRRNNLRIVNKKLQSMNRRTPSTNSSGVKGVTYDTTTKSWRAQVGGNGNRVASQSFSIALYGEDNAKQLAIEFRDRAEKEYIDSLLK